MKFVSVYIIQVAMNNYEIIGKVKLDMTHYNGKDVYSDGDVENDILAYCKQGCIQEVLLNDTRWPVFLSFISYTRKFVKLVSISE